MPLHALETCNAFYQCSTAATALSAPVLENVGCNVAVMWMAVSLHNFTETAHSTYTTSLASDSSIQFNSSGSHTHHLHHRAQQTWQWCFDTGLLAHDISNQLLKIYLLSSLFNLSSCWGMDVFLSKPRQWCQCSMSHASTASSGITPWRTVGQSSY